VLSADTNIITNIILCGFLKPRKGADMSFSRKWKRLLLLGGVMAVPAGLAINQARVQGSDHGDTAENIKRIGADLTDLYVFPSPQNRNNVVLVMNARGLITAGQASRVSFDPNVLYQFKIDNTGDSVEDLVIQAKFQGSGPQQRVFITGPVKPARTGTSSVFQAPLPASGVINRAFAPTTGMQVFAGPREDPFFFDWSASTRYSPIARRRSARRAATTTSTCPSPTRRVSTDFARRARPATTSATSTCCPSWWSSPRAACAAPTAAATARSASG
jgi:hypothetical protein